MALKKMGHASVGARLRAMGVTDNGWSRASALLPGCWFLFEMMCRWSAHSKCIMMLDEGLHTRRSALARDAALPIRPVARK
ncbi:hypothetical protein, partial [Xanthomonas campestris]|uniref:hypothetical protein n=1 Tax=Xanthomonas campestris TaxID=339 RepID=UPI0039C0140D